MTRRRTGTVRVLALPLHQPYTDLLYRHVAALGVDVEGFSRWRLLSRRCDVWHLHWPDGALNHPRTRVAVAKSAHLLLLLAAARLLRVPSVWTVHNLASHDRRHPRLERTFFPLFTRLVGGWISMSESGRALAASRYPALAGKPSRVVRHGHYRGLFPDEVGRDEARRRLGLDPGSRVLAFIGSVRPYKGWQELVEAFRRRPDDGTVLVVAGQSFEGADAVLERVAAEDRRVRYFPGHVEDADLQVFFRAADLVAIPFREVLNSGSALLALSFGAPVLVPAIGALPELQALVGDAWVRTYDGDLTPEVLDEALATPTPDGPPDLSPFEWPVVAEDTVRFYEAVVGNQSGRRAS